LQSLFPQPSICLYLSSILGASTSWLIMEHICATYKRHRSSSYHQRYPLPSGKTPELRVCSRCIRRLFFSEPREKSHIKEIHHNHYEIHHHYVYPVGDSDERINPDLPIFRAELPFESSQHPYAWVDNDIPPPVYPEIKPILPKIERHWQEEAGGYVQGQRCV
jgi:hypothetical protein